jgi:hypothetical protein
MFLVHSREECNGEDGDGGRGRDILSAKSGPPQKAVPTEETQTFGEGVVQFRKSRSLASLEMTVALWAHGKQHNNQQIYKRNWRVVWASCGQFWGAVCWMTTVLGWPTLV